VALAAIQQRIDDLEVEVAQARSGPAHGYTPKIPGSIADLSTPADALLRQLPSVVAVEVLVACPKPTHRIIHVRDWHYVRREL
jgi:hypothetical protein